VSDTGGPGLQQATLWRANADGSANDPSWQAIGSPAQLNGNGPYNGSFLDSPSIAGQYWYGIHVVDVTGSPVVSERDAGLAPIQVTVSPGGTAETVALYAPSVNGLAVQINGAATPAGSVSSITWNWGDGQPTSLDFHGTELT
jgi:hypothetical protein